MITLNTDNSTISEVDFSSKTNLLDEYLKKIEARDLGFYKLHEDKETLKKVQEFADQNRNKYDHFIVLGIGGSSLGTICLQQSLTHLFKAPKLFVLDNIDPTMLSQIEDVIDYSKTLFIIVTKSGGTPETLSQYYYFREKVPQENFVFITDPEKGILREIANKENIPAFEIPENVGGRFSVLTPVGLLPAALLGLNIADLLQGVEEAWNNKELAFKLATTQYLLSKEGKNITVMMPYSQRLIRLADWYSQLLAESIGKNENTGITPVKALGVTDQHSQLQLYNEGPKDKLLIFIEVSDLGPTLQIPENPISYLKGVSFNKLMQTELEATRQSLTKNGRPNITIKLPAVSEKTLGALFLHLELSVAFLGEFYGIDAFNQPGVELSKNLTKEMLS
ncbi:glucose-6-phosphate isomerase [Candidatus Peregrinibacteria bacterium CG10_big_fil_rev_8_21_14_0_10_36_19]|nr:MAG: glucose-6-phosphate isomerase [Candidatus Peregrinibacteria bacterium CG10_big_fil_rev_8_21_14_0_10_36_19]